MKKNIGLPFLVFIVFSSVWALIEGMSSPVSCYNNAYGEDELSLTEDEAFTLCSGARNTSAPIQCYADSDLPTEIELTDEDMISLCAGANDPKTPIACVLEVYNSDTLDLTIEETIILCQRPSSANAPLNCFNNAFFDEDGPGFDLESAIELCSGS